MENTWWGPGHAQCCACLKWREDVIGSPHVPRFYICHDCACEVMWAMQTGTHPRTGRVSGPPPGAADPSKAPHTDSTAAKAST